MKQPHFLLKLAAVVSSVLLAGGYVCYRAGAFDSFIGGSSTSGEAEAGSVSSQQPARGDQQPAKTIMYGTKSGSSLYNLPPPKTEAPAPAASQQPPAEPKQSGPQVKVIMSGSKSLFVPTQLPTTLGTPSSVQPPSVPQQQPPSTKQQKPMLLPGPKAGLIR